MIQIRNIEKKFRDICAVNNVSLRIEDGQVFGLVGTNGAGKSTLLRMVSGILRQDAGSISVCGDPVYDRPDVKRQIFFIPDDPFFFRNGTAEDMCRYYMTVYPAFDPGRFRTLLADFCLDPRRKIRNYSRGMKKQLAVVCGICSNATYLLCDETFDGLDPVMRQAVKSLFANDMSERDLTPVIASHNLRELEDICDHVGLLHSGGLLLSRDLADLKLGLQKVQCVFADEAQAEAIFGRTDASGIPDVSFLAPGERGTGFSAFSDHAAGRDSAEFAGSPASASWTPAVSFLNPGDRTALRAPSEKAAAQALAALPLLRHERRGRLHTLTVRASREEVQSCFEHLDMAFFEILPLTLEEIFISETEVVGYDVRKFILK